MVSRVLFVLALLAAILSLIWVISDKTSPEPVIVFIGSIGYLIEKLTRNRKENTEGM